MTAYTEDKREMSIGELEMELEKTKKEIAELEINKQYLVERANSIMKRISMISRGEVTK